MTDGRRADAPLRTALRSGSVARATVVVVGIGFLVVAGLMTAWNASSSLLLLFAGLLMASFLDVGVWLLGKLLPLARRWRAIIAALVVLAVAAAAVFYGGRTLVRQSGEIVGTLEAQIDMLQAAAADLGIPGLQMNEIEAAGEGAAVGTVVARVRTAASIALSILSGLVVIFFFGFFLAMEPQLYRDGLVSLLPIPRRARLAEVLDELGQTLRRWLLGQSVSMVVVFAVAYPMFLWIGLPYPFLLALQAGLLTFIPLIGQFIAGVPIILIGMSVGGTTGMYAIAAYVVLQVLESNVLTPLVQRRAVYVPPALILGGQVLMGTLFGFAGLVLAVPVIAVVRVAVQELYVKDTLESGSVGDPNPKAVATAGTR